jgi:feruloyl esterase
MSVINATNPDLSQFASHGGKLLLKSNTSDYTAGARIPIQYYESVVAAMGRLTVDQFMRHYNLVGAWHNRNVGTNTVTGATVPYYGDFIALVDNWVEDGNIPPDNITATFQDGIRRSQCALPAYVAILSTPIISVGDPTNAINFRCVTRAVPTENFVSFWRHALEVEV